MGFRGFGGVEFSRWVAVLHCLQLRVRLRCPAVSKTLAQLHLAVGPWKEMQNTAIKLHTGSASSDMPRLCRIKDDYSFPEIFTKTEAHAETPTQGRWPRPNDAKPKLKRKFRASVVWISVLYLTRLPRREIFHCLSKNFIYSALY